MKALTLTTNEINFLKQCANYKNAEEQISDNYSNAGLAEASEIMGSVNKGKGLLGSLVAKGCGWMDDEGYDIFWLNEGRIIEIWDIIYKD